MPNNKYLKDLILETRQKINLRDSVIEKDYYVTQVIHALSGVEDEHFRLVFCGGTCLAKAHKIVSRMSEDIDFKIQLKKMGVALSRTQLIKTLKKFRSHIKSRLVPLGLKTEEPIVRNEGKYSRIVLSYPSAFPANIGLRPHILAEFTLSDFQLSTESMSVRTLIEDTLKNISLFTPTSIQCISINETAIEKWVGLTRRIIAIERKYHHDDSTLVRHIYDLNSIKLADKMGIDFFILAKIIICNDAKQFKNQHPEYSANPSSEIKNSLSLLKNKQLWKERYQEFIETMVYNNHSTPSYENAITLLEAISAEVIEALPQ